MSTEKEDQNWLEALGGKRAADNSAPETIEAQALRSAMLHKIQNEEQFEPTHAAYQKILEEANRRKLLKEESKKWNWFGLTGRNGLSISGSVLATPTYAMASIVLIFGLTAIVGYQALELRRVDSRSTAGEIFRGFSSHEEDGKSAEISTEITLNSAAPLTQVNSIINATLDSKLIAKVSQLGDGYQVIIYDMHSMSKDEVALKALIGIPNQVSGNIRVIVKNK